jgi:hypothetical protein
MVSEAACQERRHRFALFRKRSLAKDWAGI